MMSIKDGELTPEDSLRLKGIAILMIVLHNFFHLVRAAPRENEFYFSKANSDAFLDIICNTPQETVRCLFSFFGHFGVQVFIFLSAYGLTKKFLASSPAYWTFIKTRYMKIYPIFLLAVGLWLSKIAFFSGPSRALDFLWNKDLFFCVLGISNLVPGQQFKPIGPWWFLSFIFQFYFVFPLLFCYAQKTKERGLIALGAAGIVFMFLCNDYIMRNLNVNLYFSMLGHMPEIALAMIWARRQKPINYPVIIGVVAMVIFALGIPYKSWWRLNHICALILLLGLYHLSKPVIRKYPWLNRILLFYGAISLPLFLVNGYLREPLLAIAQKKPYWLSDMAYALAFLLFATIVAVMLHLCNVRLIPYGIQKINALIHRNFKR